MANIVNMKSPKQNRCDVETNKIIILWGWSKLWPYSFDENFLIKRLINEIFGGYGKSFEFDK